MPKRSEYVPKFLGGTPCGVGWGCVFAESLAQGWLFRLRRCPNGLMLVGAFPLLEVVLMGMPSFRLLCDASGSLTFPASCSTSIHYIFKSST